MSEQKIKSDTSILIGENIREIRKAKKIGQTELVRSLDLLGVSLTRESLVKIERGIQHIYASQLRAIRYVLQTSYDELLNKKRSIAHKCYRPLLLLYSFQIAAPADSLRFS